MSNYQQIFNRFLKGISFKDGSRGSTYRLAQQETYREFKPFLENLVEDNLINSEDDLAKCFLHFLIEAKHIYRFLWKNQAKTSAIFSYTLCYKIAKLFLFNYLQLICFYAARDVSQKLRQTSSCSHYALEDCFIIGVEIALAPIPLLKGFSFDSQTSLQTYASVALNRTIKNTIVKELKTKSLKFSDNGLLRNITKSKLEAALNNFGISEKNIIKYCLAWQAFNELFLEIYPPTSSDASHHRKPPTTALTNEQLNQIAIRYNRQLQRLKIQQPAIDSQTIKQMLATCVQSVRNLQNKKLVSIEDNNCINEIASEAENELVTEEIQQKSKDVKDIILHEFKTLDKSDQKSLLLWLGLEINQNDFLHLLHLEKQYQVARHFQRNIKTILKAFVKSYSQNIMNQNLKVREVDKLCKDKLNDVKEYLTMYSKAFFRQILIKIVPQKINKSDKLLLIKYLDILTDYNRQRIKNIEMKNTLDNAYLETKNSIVKIQQPFSVEIENQLEIQLQQFSSAIERIESFIENWLIVNQAILYK
ncbi:MAG: hypothetical protein KI793_05620 [Rivularia sp. (in: Bacteria)]|nr:hypothetical protein [Rivularia sp. MS3]